jgi:hypothetical protein
MKPKHKFSGQPSGACPNYFRIVIWRIRTGNLEYHNQGYDDPAWHLSIHLANEFEGERTELEELGILVDKEDDDGIIAWFKNGATGTLVQMQLALQKRKSRKVIWQEIKRGRVCA